MLIQKIAHPTRGNVFNFSTSIHFGHNPSSTEIAEKRNRRHSAPARYTLRARKEKNQISQAQFRSKSGAPASIADKETEEEKSRAGDSGRDQETIAGATSEIWF